MPSTSCLPSERRGCPPCPRSADWTSSRCSLIFIHRLLTQTPPSPTFGGRRIFSLFRIAVRRLVELRVHARGYALGFKRGLEFGANVRVFLVIGHGGPPLLSFASSQARQLLPPPSSPP